MATPTIGALPASTHQNRITLTGGKSSGTAIFIDGIARVVVDDRTVWTAAVDLQEGLNTFEVIAMDDLGNLSGPLIVEISRDTVPPAAPTLSAPTSSPTNPATLSGTKEPGTFVRLNGRRITELSDATTWEYRATLAIVGDNTVSVTAVDEAGNESVSADAVVTLTAASCDRPPQPVFPLDGRAIQWGVAFSWSQVSASTYDLEVSASPGFESLLLDEPVGAGQTEFAPIGLAPSRGEYYWRVGAVNACGTSYGPTRKVVIGSTTGDVNGDGYADVLAGAYTDSRAGGGAGAAYLYHGGAGADADVVADVVLTGRGPGDTFGTSVAKVGDIDQDGYVDFLVGAPRVDRDSQDDDTGVAYLYWGGPAMTTTASVVFHGETDQSLFGMSASGVGDVNGDGFPDLAVGAYQTLVVAECNGIEQELPLVGRVYVYFGGPRDEMDTLADVVLTGETTEIPNDRSSACRSGDEFGLSVAGVGDINGDGYDDIAVGARGHDDGVDADAGRAYVFFGGPWFVGVGAERANVVLTGDAADDQFGAAVAGPGDTNGDGFADLLVGAHQSDAGGTDSGSASWYGGGPDGVTMIQQFSGAVAGDSFGASMAPAGDIDRDGFADMVIGAYLVGASPNDSGAVSYYRGNALGTVLLAGKITGEITPNPDDQFGRAVAGIGDIDGDGFDDTVVGATGHDECFLLADFCFDAGRAYVIVGPSVTNRGANGDPRDWLLSGLRPGDRLGSWVN
ncbi:MAG: hypothetical protein ACOYXR_12195 [Nitrospirota bacterium]